VKRDPSLRAFSRDHHHALVLARYIAGICARNAIEPDVVAVIRERFKTEILPHFAVEEVLLDALTGYGVDHLVARTRDEHAQMLRLLEASGPTVTSCMCELGQLLTAHVRFEERELYPACEERLSAADLERAAKAHDGERPRARR
jgi:hypothetical protein